MQNQLDELQLRCRSLDSAVTHGETEKRDLLEHLAKLVQAVDDRDAKLKEQVLMMPEQGGGVLGWLQRFCSYIFVLTFVVDVSFV